MALHVLQYKLRWQTRALVIKIILQNETNHTLQSVLISVGILHHSPYVSLLRSPDHIRHTIMLLPIKARS